MIKAVLFDMDGVLIDAKEWHYLALNKALHLFNLEISRTDHLLKYDGLPTKQKLELLSSESGISLDHALISKLKQEYTASIIERECKPLPHHIHALSTLKEEGYRLAVCSNSIRKSVTMMMERSRLNTYLDFYLSNNDVIKPKPDPEIYLKAMVKFNLSPKECLIVEDSPFGIRAAVSSGAHLLEVQDVFDVTYENIKQKLEVINYGEHRHPDGRSR
jgi:beta-phosphoglucomutase